MLLAHAGTASPKGLTAICPKIIMVSSASEKSRIVIRDIELIAEMREVESLQKDVWECDDRDIVPLTILAATREARGDSDRRV